MIGWIKDETGSFPLALMPIAVVATIGTICVLVIGRNQPRTVAATTWHGDCATRQSDLFGKFGVNGCRSAPLI